MSNIITFTPRPRPAPPEAAPPQPEASLRARVEAAAEIAVDTAERLIAILDTWDGDADLEPDVDAEPSLAAPENAHGSQVPWMRGGDEDRETARLAALTVRLWRLNYDLAATHRRVERHRTEAAGDELLRVARLWLATQDAIRALIGGPEPPHVAGVRASLGMPLERERP